MSQVANASEQGVRRWRPPPTRRWGVLEVTIPAGVRVRLENAGDAEARSLVVLTPADFTEHLEGWPADG